MAQPFIDTFDGAGSTTNLEDWTPTGGTAWTRQDGVAAGATVPTAGSLRGNTTTPTSYVCDDQGSADHYVIFRAKTQTSYASNVAVRLVDASNCIGWRIQGTGSTGRRLQKVVGGTATDLITSQSVDEEFLKIEVSGTTVALYEGGTGGTPGTWTQVGTDQTVSDGVFTGETSIGVRIAHSATTAWVDDFEAGALAGGTDASVTLAGASSTASAGTLTIAGAASQAITGAGTSSAAGALGLSADASNTITGASSAASAGTLSASAVTSASVTLTGATSTASAGTLTASGDASTTLTGVDTASSAGTVTASAGGDATIALTGAAASASTGILQASGTAQIVVTGIQITASAGVVTATATDPNAAVTLSGASATAYAGILLAGDGLDDTYPPGGDISINDLDRQRRIEDDDLIAVVVGFLVASREIR